MRASAVRTRVGTNGITLSCLVAGRGAELAILLHGFPQTALAWRAQLGPLAERFRVVAPDLRGYGESDKPRGVGAYRLAVLAEDIGGLIHSLGGERAHLVGHDWGGAIAMALAATHPEMVDRLVVINCPHPAALARALRTSVRQLLRSWYVFFFQVPWLAERAITRPGAIAGTLRRSAPRGTFDDADLAAYERALRAPGAATAALSYYRAAFRGALRGRATAQRPIAAPTLVLWGERDQALGVELTRGMASFFAGPFVLRTIPDCGHWVLEERPALVREALGEWLGEAR